jgi:hypothetical protein
LGALALFGAPGWFARVGRPGPAFVRLQPCRLEPLRSTAAPDLQELLELEPGLPCFRSSAVHDGFRDRGALGLAELLPVQPSSVGHVVRFAYGGAAGGLGRLSCDSRSNGIRKGESGIRNQPGRSGAGLFRLAGGLTGLYGVGTVLVRCRYGALGFLDVRVLVLIPLHDLDGSNTADAVAQDEPGALELAQHGVNVAIVVRQHFGLDPLGTILEPPGAVSHRPQSDEQEAGQRLELGHTVMGEEAGLDVPSSSHLFLSLPKLVPADPAEVFPRFQLSRPTLRHGDLDAAPYLVVAKLVDEHAHAVHPVAGG